MWSEAEPSPERLGWVKSIEDPRIATAIATPDGSFEIEGADLHRRYRISAVASGFAPSQPHVATAATRDLIIFMRRCKAVVVRVVDPAGAQVQPAEGALYRTLATLHREGGAEAVPFDSLYGFQAGARLPRGRVPGDAGYYFAWVLFARDVDADEAFEFRLSMPGYRSTSAIVHARLMADPAVADEVAVETDGVPVGDIVVALDLRSSDKDAIERLHRVSGRTGELFCIQLVPRRSEAGSPDIRSIPISQPVPDRASLHGLPCGRYFVGLRTDLPLSIDAPAQVEFEVQPGRETVVPVRIGPHGSVQIAVYESDGEAYFGPLEIHVEWGPDEGERPTGIIAYSKGPYVLNCVAPGEYRICAKLAGFGSRWERATVAANGVAIVSARIESMRALQR
jgi:hypothetical protein